MANSPKTYVASAKIEMFYNDVLESSIRHKLSDAETVAILSAILGKFIGAPGISEQDKSTFVDTAIYNLRSGAENIERLIAEIKAH